MGEPNRRIEGKTRAVGELLKGARYSIDYYQRDYAWETRQIRELIEDLTSKFEEDYDPSDSRSAVAGYPHYFLGSIVVSHKNGQKFLVDGQQRLTSLTLLLIALYHRGKGVEGVPDVRELIFSTRYGTKSFNLDVEGRTSCMEHLFEDKAFDASAAIDSVRNLVARYADIKDLLPDEITGTALPYFIDWLLENVHLVEIETYSDEDAYTIFETMNDRGRSLSLPEMLKGYLLANVDDERDQQRLNEQWKARNLELRKLGKDEDVDFYKNWLRGRHATTARTNSKSTENADYERIGNEFHRWVKDSKDAMGLDKSSDYVRFIERDFDFYARQALRIRGAARRVTKGLESIRFNEDRAFTMQTQVLLAAVSPDDAEPQRDQKLKMVADYLDIMLARRVWSFRSVAQSTLRYQIFTLTKSVRDRSVAELSAHLRGLLDDDPLTFAKAPEFSLHHTNYRQVRHVLARLTLWLDEECGVATHFDDLISEGKGKAFEIEHVWANKYGQFTSQASTPQEFEQARNRLGGLLLLQRGINQSLADKPYEAKRDAYGMHSHNLLARSLHPLAYTSNPAFTQLIARTGLGFRAIDVFDRAAQDERQELYLRLAEWVWNPSRVDVDGIKPVNPELIDPPNDDDDDGPAVAGGDNRRHAERHRYWSALLDAAKGGGALHANLSPGVANYISKRKHGVYWNFVVRMNDLRVEVDIASAVAAENRALFDKLYADRAAIERAFGGPLDWQRPEERRSCRIAAPAISGGWTDDSTWPAAIATGLKVMQRLYDAVSPRLVGVGGDGE